jgi:hypothetical protein
MPISGAGAPVVGPASTQHLVRVGVSYAHTDVCSLGEASGSWGYGSSAKKCCANAYVNYGQVGGAAAARLRTCTRGGAGRAAGAAPGCWRAAGSWALRPGAGAGEGPHVRGGGGPGDWYFEVGAEVPLPRTAQCTVRAAPTPPPQRPPQPNPRLRHRNAPRVPPSPQTFGPGDEVVCMVDLTATPGTLSFVKNGLPLGTAYQLPRLHTGGAPQPLLPHVMVRGPAGRAFAKLRRGAAASGAGLRGGCWGRPQQRACLSWRALLVVPAKLRSSGRRSERRRCEAAGLITIRRPYCGPRGKG